MSSRSCALLRHVPRSRAGRPGRAPRARRVQRQALHAGSLWYTPSDLRLTYIAARVSHVDHQALGRVQREMLSALTTASDHCARPCINVARRCWLPADWRASLEHLLIISLLLASLGLSAEWLVRTPRALHGLQGPVQGGSQQPQGWPLDR